MSIRRLVLAAVVAATCCIAACHKTAETAATPNAQAIAMAQATTAHPAWLRTHLPANVVAYARVPSPWALIGTTPNGSPLDAAATDPRQLAVVSALRQAAGNQPQLGKTAVGDYIGMAFSRLSSPLEVVLIDASGMPTPNAQMLLTAQFAVTDAAQVAALFSALPSPSMHLSGALDAHGDGNLTMGARVHFDASDKRVFVLAGTHPPSKADLDALLTPAPGKQSPSSLANIEARIDSSGQGLFAWIKLQGWAGMAAGFLPADLADSLPADLARHVDAVAFGSGTVHGHGRISVVLHAPGARALDYLAPTLDLSGLNTAGAANWAFTFALPTATKVRAFEANLNTDLGSRTAANWRKVDDLLRNAGVPDLATLTQLIGPEIVVFNDSNGTYTAVRLRDAKALQAQLDKLVSRYHWEIGSDTSGKAQVHWLSAPGLVPTTKGQTASNAAALQSLLQRLRTHVYWIRDGNWMIFADVPQALADRVASGNFVGLGDWFKHQDYASGTWVGTTAVSHNAQRRAYYHYLGALVVLGDLFDHPVNIMPLPSASALGLPERSIIGGGIVLTPDSLALNLDYGQLPTEFLQGQGGMTAVAMSAILAAVAIPAYQDYMIRAQVSEGMVMGASAKVAVAEYYQAQGHLPANDAAVGLPAPEANAGKFVGSVAVEAGTIRITFGAPPAQQTDAKIAGKSLLLTPHLSGSAIVWRCSSNEIPGKYLPSSCRQQ